MDDEDIIMPDEEVDTPVETEEGKVEQENQPEPEMNEDEKFLEYLNKKGLIKFNGENVAVKDINDLVTNYQKGLNYDKVATRENKVMDYIKEKASNLNISPEEYIERVKNYEKQKEQELADRDIQNLVNKGIDEDLAREIVETKLARKEFEKEKAEMQKRLAEDEAKKKEDAEYIEFINTHPDIKVDEIPQEVFELSKSIGLNAAYNQYENKILKEKLQQLEQAQKNASTSPVGLTTDGSSTEQMSKDPFLEGFDSVI